MIPARCSKCGFILPGISAKAPIVGLVHDECPTMGEIAQQAADKLTDIKRDGHTSEDVDRLVSTVQALLTRAETWAAMYKDDDRPSGSVMRTCAAIINHEITIEMLQGRENHSEQV